MLPLDEALSPCSREEASDEGSNAICKSIESTFATTPPTSITKPSLPTCFDLPEPAKNNRNLTLDYMPRIDTNTATSKLRAVDWVDTLRKRALRTRTSLKHHRERLRSLRKDVREALDTLVEISSGDAAMESSQQPGRLKPYYKAIQKFQDEMHHVEDVYEQLESQLENEEQELKCVEDYLYSHFDVSGLVLPYEILNDCVSPITRPQLSSSGDIASPEPIDPLQSFFEQYEAARHLKEELDDLETKFSQLSHEASVRSRHDIALSAETAAFLGNFETSYSRALEKLHTVEEQLFSLRRECTEQGLLNETEHAYEARDALKEEVLDFVEDARCDRSPIRIAIHNFQYREIPQNYDDKRDYVNKWLLQWVQNSSLESLMLRAWIVFQYPEKAKELAEDEWSELAVENWDTDSMGKAANENHNESQMDVIGANESEAIASGLSSDLGILIADLDRNKAEDSLWELDGGSQGTVRHEEGFKLVARPRANTI